MKSTSTGQKWTNKSVHCNVLPPANVCMLLSKVWQLPPPACCHPCKRRNSNLKYELMCAVRLTSKRWVTDTPTKLPRTFSTTNLYKLASTHAYASSPTDPLNSVWRQRGGPGQSQNVVNVLKHDSDSSQVCDQSQEMRKRFQHRFIRSECCWVGLLETNSWWRLQPPHRSTSLKLLQLIFLEDIWIQMMCPRRASRTRVQLPQQQADDIIMNCFLKSMKEVAL